MQTKISVKNKARIRAYKNGGYAKNRMRRIKAGRLKIPPEVGEGERNTPIAQIKDLFNRYFAIASSGCLRQKSYFLTYPLPERRKNEQWKS